MSDPAAQLLEVLAGLVAGTRYDTAGVLHGARPCAAVVGATTDADPLEVATRCRDGNTANLATCPHFGCADDARTARDHVRVNDIDTWVADGQRGGLSLLELHEVLTHDVHHRDPARPTACCDRAWSPHPTLNQIGALQHRIAHDWVSARTCDLGPDGAYLAVSPCELTAPTNSPALRALGWRTPWTAHRRLMSLYPLPEALARQYATELRGTVLPLDGVDTPSWRVLTALLDTSYLPPGPYTSTALVRDARDALPALAATAWDATHEATPVRR